MMLTHHTLPRQMLIEAESHRLLMQNAHSVAAGQSGRTEARIAAEERSLRRSQCRVFSISCSRTLRCARAFAAPPASRNTTLPPAACKRPILPLHFYSFFFFLNTCKLWSFCYYRTITFSDSISRLPVVNAKCSATAVILSLVSGVVDCFVCEKCGDCAAIPSADGRRREPSGLVFVFFFPLRLNGLQTAAMFG